MTRGISELRQLIMGFRNTQLLYVAAKLDIADRLAPGPKSSGTLAEETGTDAGALFRFLRALTALGITAQLPDERFTLTDAGELLRTDVPGSLRDVALLYGQQWLWNAYGGMLSSVSTGSSAFTAIHGCDLYEFLDRHPDAGAVFRNAMNAFSDSESAAILQAYDFSAAKTIIDIGAGGGALLAAILHAYPEARGNAFDVPRAARECERRFEAPELAGRATFTGGDFFDSVPEGYDLYTLKSVLHNWEDEAAIDILRACRRAISRTGRLLVIERVITDARSSAEAKLFDINMLVVLGGRERTEQEYRTLLATAGFVLSRLVPTASPMTVLEAAPRVD